MDTNRQDLEHINTLVTQGDLAGAEKFCREQLTLAASDERRILLLDALVNLLQASGQLEEAETTCRQELSLLENMFGHEHQYVADALHNLTLVLDQRNKFDEAITVSQRELDILTKALPSDNPRLAEAKVAMAKHLYETSRFDEAKVLLLDALQAFEAAEGRESLGVSACLNNLGRIKENQGENKEGVALLAEAAGIRKKLLGKHPETAFTLLNYGTALAGVGRIHEAANVLTECAAMYAHLGMAETRLYQACQSNLNVCRREITRRNQENNQGSCMR